MTGSYIFQWFFKLFEHGKYLYINNSSQKQNLTEIVSVEELNKKLQTSFNKITTLDRSRLENSKRLVATTLEKEKLSVVIFFSYFLE